MDINKKVVERLRDIKEMKAEIGKSKFLKEIFDESWFNELEFQVRDNSNYQGANNLFRSKTHHLFNNYINNLYHRKLSLTDQNIILLLDDSCNQIFKSISGNKKNSFKNKIKVFKTFDPAQYAGYIFEVITLGKLAKFNYLYEYEPRIVDHKEETADARIKIKNENFIVEVTASLPKLFGEKSYDIESKIESVCLSVPECVNKIVNKIYTKYEQTKLSKSPVLLILCNASSFIQEEEIFIALKKLRKAYKLGNIVFIALSGSHFGEPSRLYLNDSGNFKIKHEVINEIETFYGIQSTIKF